MFNPARRRRSHHLAGEKANSPLPGPVYLSDANVCLPDNTPGDGEAPLATTPANTPATAVETTSPNPPAKEILLSRGGTEEDKVPKDGGSAHQPTNQETPGEVKVVKAVGKDTQPSSGTAKPSYIPAETIEDNDRLWKDYMKEATEEDKDMLDSWNNDLETLLVFSGLFSAILTAFLIESHKDLKPDPSSTIVAAIERGFRLANNITDSALATGPEPFTAQVRSVRINALWFCSLSMSLISAAGAMLAKSWLVAYSHHLSIGSSVQRAEKRQKRFDGLNQWKFQATIDFLPFPLFFSIILFAIGLFDFLLGLHKMIAILSASIFLFGLAFLIIVNLLRIIIPDCPYHIPIPIDPPSIKEVEAFSQRIEGQRYSIQGRLEGIMLDIRFPDSDGFEKWLAVPPLIAQFLVTLIHLLVVYLLGGLLKSLLLLMRLNEDWTLSASARQDWQARGLSWLIHSSSDDGVVRNALQLIPAVCTRVANIDVLCKTEVLSALDERFIKAIDDHAEKPPGTDAAVPELAVETYALGHSLRLLAGYRRHMLRGVASSDETRFGEIWWVNVVPPSHSTPIHLLCKSLSLVTYHPTTNPSSSAGLQADLVWVLKSTSDLGDWLRLFLIQDAADLHPPFADDDKDEGTLSMICGLMSPVKLTVESSATFLSAINNLYSGLDLSGRTVTPSSILVRYESANFGRELASIYSWCTNKIKGLYEEHVGSEQYLRLLENASIILLKIAHLLQWQLDLDDPKAPNSKDIKSFIKWTLTHPDFPIQVRAEAIKILSNLNAEYTAGWEGEGEIKKYCVEVISQFEDDPTQDDATISAVNWLIQHLEISIEGGRTVLDFLEGHPEVAAGIVGIIRRDETEQIWNLYMLEAELSAKGFKYDSGILCISPLNDNVPDEATSLTCQILSKPIDAGLKEAVISRLTAQNGKQEFQRAVRLILWTVCGSSLAKSFILDHRFTAQLISCAKQPLSLPKDRWQYVAILIQLSYQVVDVCSDKEQATWHRSLIELKFLTVYATLLPFVKDREPKGSMMWDIQCSFPVLQALIQTDREVVAESKVIEAIEAVLRSFASSGVQLAENEFPGSTWSDSNRLGPDTVLQELNNIRASMIGTDPQPTTLPARDDELPL